jgi:hypothetical protein
LRNSISNGKNNSLNDPLFSQSPYTLKLLNEINKKIEAGEIKDNPEAARKVNQNCNLYRFQL